MFAKPVVGIGRDMVKLVDRDQPAVEGVDAEPVDGETEGGVSADHDPVVAFEKRPDRIDLAAIGARRVAEIPLRGNDPVGPESELAQRRVGEARADGPLGHHDDGLAEALIVQLVERDEHQCPALARCRRRLDQEILLASLLPGPLLHRTHAELVGPRGVAATGIGDRNGGDGVIHGKA